jgi:hypothetical protein
VKPVETVLRRGEGVRESDRGGEFDQGHHMHAWKYHNETPLYE